MPSTLEALGWASDACGWLYFAAWSVSFYPQVALNRQRKSVAGLSFEWLMFNTSGFFFYTVYCVVTRWAQLAHGLVVTVQVNDVAFAAHALLLSLVTVAQCLRYDRGGQTLDRRYAALCGGMWLLLAGHAGLAAVGLIPFVRTTNDLGYQWTVMQYLGIVKAVISAVKGVPQVYLNYVRRSTEGWSIVMPWLDFTGGVLSFLQNAIDAYRWQTWAPLVGNVPKLLLSLISIAFDLVYFTQHYILYRRPKFEPVEDSDPDPP
eukprot:EG_transcript_24668